MWKVALFFVLAVGGARAQSPSTEYNFVCTFVDNLDCRSVDYNPVCASNGVQYKTECDFTKAHCKDVSLSVVNEGPCGGSSSTLPPRPTSTPFKTTMPSTVATTPSAVSTMMPSSTVTMTTTTAAGSTPMPTLSILCQTLVTQTCPPDNSPVCASDLISYPSLCEYTKARCLNPSLTVVVSGDCSQITTPLPSVNDIICNAILNSQCFDDGIILCGSNGVSYGNSCDYEKAKCNNPQLSVAYTGSCKN